jgi:hypothetical protein
MRYLVYHSTYTSAVETALEWAKLQGWEHSDDEVFREISLGPRKPSPGYTNKFSIGLHKPDGKGIKYLNMQIYGMDEGRYELNCYLS